MGVGFEADPIPNVNSIFRLGGLQHPVTLASSVIPRLPFHVLGQVQSVKFMVIMLGGAISSLFDSVDLVVAGRKHQRFLYLAVVIIPEIEEWDL